MSNISPDELLAARRSLGNIHHFDEVIEIVARRNKRIAELEAEVARLEGRACLICGRSEPCKEAPDACTFDPSPIKAAQAFLRRAEAAEQDVRRLEWMERNPCRATDLLSSVCGEWVNNRHKARTVRAAIDAARSAAEGK